MTLDPNIPLRHNPCEYHCKASGERPCSAGLHARACVEERAQCKRCATIRQGHQRGCLCAACFPQSEDYR